MPSTTDDIAIQATDLRKTYGSEVALKSVSLSIPTGTVYGFLGPNGAGKTTTMRLLTGLSRPTSGTVSIRGVSVDDRRDIASLVGYLPEIPPLYEEFSAREQLEYVADLRDIPRSTARNRVNKYLDRFELVDDADRRISGYSKGMKQKTAFIQSVIHDPDVLFFSTSQSILG
jgi:ABC-2 type transport system ATP-binding protein